MSSAARAPEMQERNRSASKRWKNACGAVQRGKMECVETLWTAVKRNHLAPKPKSAGLAGDQSTLPVAGRARELSRGKGVLSSRLSWCGTVEASGMKPVIRRILETLRVLAGHPGSNDNLRTDIQVQPHPNREDGDPRTRPRAPGHAIHANPGHRGHLKQIGFRPRFGGRKNIMVASTTHAPTCALTPASSATYRRRQIYHAHGRFHPAGDQRPRHHGDPLPHHRRKNMKKEQRRDDYPEYAVEFAHPDFAQSSTSLVNWLCRRQKRIGSTIRLASPLVRRDGARGREDRSRRHARGGVKVSEPGPDSDNPLAHLVRIVAFF